MLIGATAASAQGIEIRPAGSGGPSIGIGSDDDRWTVELWANNLFDEDYIQVGFNGPFQVDENNDAVSTYDAFLGAPRTWGVTARLRY